MLMLSLFRLVAAVVPWVVNLATWMLARSPEHAAAVGARHRRLRVLAGADDRKQGRQGALPDAADASAPVAAVALIPVSPKSPKAKENCHDPSVNIPEPRPAGRCHLQRRISRRAYARRRHAGAF